MKLCIDKSIYWFIRNYLKSCNVYKFYLPVNYFVMDLMLFIIYVFGSSVIDNIISKSKRFLIIVFEKNIAVCQSKEFKILVWGHCYYFFLFLILEDSFDF